jgi:hypothetical protein
VHVNLTSKAGATVSVSLFVSPLSPSIWTTISSSGTSAATAVTLSTTVLPGLPAAAATAAAMVANRLLVLAAAWRWLHARPDAPRLGLARAERGDGAHLGEALNRGDPVNAVGVVGGLMQRVATALVDNGGNLGGAVARDEERRDLEQRRAGERRVARCAVQSGAPASSERQQLVRRVRSGAFDEQLNHARRLQQRCSTAAPARARRRRPGGRGGAGARAKRADRAQGGVTTKDVHRRAPEPIGSSAARYCGAKRHRGEHGAPCAAVGGDGAASAEEHGREDLEERGP